MPELTDQIPDQRIHLMDDVLASQVAAGEVVERPASVLKELVENSIDAGAHVVRVEVRRGGVALLKVTDDGCGMSRVDAGLCLKRHATSKLLSFEGLFDIRQLGFRGEALPSIASVAQVQIQTRRAEDVEGTLIRCEGGSEPQVLDAGCAPGTEISVSQLFFNTPVRRKFLKSEETEYGHVEHQLRLHALAFPQVRFVLVRDGSPCFDLPATHDLRQRIAEFIGRDQAMKLMRIRPTEAPGVRVTGFLMPLSESRRNRRMQYVFLNGRPIEDKIVTRAIRDGYGGFPTGLHPSLFLYLEVDPGLVDVNVHPSKREVRFRRPSDVTMAVMEAIGATLAAHARGEQEQAPPAVAAPPLHQAKPLRQQQSCTEVPGVSSPPVAATSSPSGASSPRFVLRPLAEPQQRQLELPQNPPPVAEACRDAKPTAGEPQGGVGAGKEAAPSPQEGAAVKARGVSSGKRREMDESGAESARSEPEHDLLPKFRYIGCLHHRYALFENSEGLVLMNPRAARERIIFERLLETNRRPLASQGLLTPLMLEWDVRDMGAVLQILPQLEQAGFSVTPFGRTTLRVEAVPALLPLDDAEPFLYELMNFFVRGEGRVRRSRNPFEPFAIRLAHQYAAVEEIEPWLQRPLPLLVDLLRCEIPYCTPSGKPTLVPFATSEINRKFQMS